MNQIPIKWIIIIVACFLGAGTIGAVGWKIHDHIYQRGKDAGIAEERGRALANCTKDMKDVRKNRDRKRPGKFKRIKR